MNAQWVMHKDRCPVRTASEKPGCPKNSAKACKTHQGGGVSKIIVCPTIIQEAYTHTVCVRMCVKNCGNGSARWFECTVIYYSIEKKFKNIYTKEIFSYF